MAIIIVDSKTQPQDTSETTSDVNHSDGPPPEYVAEETSHRTNDEPVNSGYPPFGKPTPSQPTNHDRWWKRWARSPIAISLTFLGCAVIATGIGLAVHFTVGRPQQQQYPYPDQGQGPYGPGGNQTGGDPYGPWSSSVKTFTFPRTTAHMEFLSLQGLVDGFTQVNVGHPGQADIEADVNITWKAHMLSSTPVVNSYYDPNNSSISITSPPSVYNDSMSLADVFIYANITIRFPANFNYGTLELRSIAQSPHCWVTSIADLTSSNIAFDSVVLESGYGSMIVQNLAAKHFEAYSQYGDIYGTVEASQTYNVTAKNGVNSLVNIDNATATNLGSRRAYLPIPRGAFRLDAQMLSQSCVAPF